MKHRAKYHSCEVLGTSCKLETTCDKLGNIEHCVTIDLNGRPFHLFFKHLSSAIDFVNSNMEE